MPRAPHQFGLVDDVRLNHAGRYLDPSKSGLDYEVGWQRIGTHKVASLE